MLYLCVNQWARVCLNLKKLCHSGASKDIGENGLNYTRAAVKSTKLKYKVGNEV